MAWNAAGSLIARSDSTLRSTITPAFAKADLVLDTVPTPGDIDRALARLETTARERGTAVGMANALPVSIELIAKWAKAAESRGLLLVPISAVVAKAKSS